MTAALRRVGQRRTPTLDPTTPHGASTALLADLNRCKHGRHKNDTCPQCGGVSQGNEFLEQYSRVGTDAHGYPIKVPAAHDVAMPGAWRENCAIEPLPETRAEVQVLENKFQKEADALAELVERVTELFGGRPDVVAQKGFLQIASEIYDERVRQEHKFGVQDHPDGTSEQYREIADKKREVNKKAFREGKPTYAKILTEEFFEALAEEDEDRLRTELIQVAAVAVQWVQAIDRRSSRDHTVVSFRGR